MAIVINLDVVLAQRKMKLKQLSETVGISTVNLSILKQGKVKEVIFALSATMEGDTTIFYINKQLTAFEILISTIARGIPVGDELEYADEVTLGRSILKRIPYEDSLQG